MREPAGAVERRGLQRRRSRLLVQGFGASPEAAESAAEAAAADDAGAIASRLQTGVGGAGRKAIAAPRVGQCVGFASPKQSCKLEASEFRADRKSSGAAERRFRLSHSILSNA